MATITPFVKRMRAQGGTIYTFTSALEDIGLNINERNNIVKMSHYALLNIPSIDAPDNLQQNRFNIFAIPGAWEAQQGSGSVKDGRVIVAESFQNYALNLETILLAQDDYNPALSTTISERVFWKWLKETSAIRWRSVDTSAGTYWQEEIDADSSVGYNSIVKCIGTISAGSVRTDTFGTYNETYILVPTSFGQTPVYFKQVEDDNYYHGFSIVNGISNIYGRETYLYPHPDGLDFQAYYDLADSSTTTGSYTMQYDSSDGIGMRSGWWWTPEGFSTSNDNCYFIDVSSYTTTGFYNVDLKYTYLSSVIEFRRSKVDCMSLEFDLDNLKTILGDSALTFDSLAIEYAEDDNFDFNAVMIYYSVYNKTLDKVLATNLLGILFLDPPSGNTTAYPLSEILLPSITKLQSGPSGFGTSYSFRLNIKSDYMLDDTQAIVTDTTASQQVLEDFSQIFDNLGKTLSILNQHTGTINYITEQYLDITTNQTNIENQISDIQYRLNDVERDITGTEDTIAMFSNGDDPLIDSSIYMKYGKLGFFTNNPTWKVQIDASLKTKDIYIENAIRDTSGNIIIGYGSPIQIGNSTNHREINFYYGEPSSAISIDTSGNIHFNNYVYIHEDLAIDNWNVTNFDVSGRLYAHINSTTLNPGYFRQYHVIGPGVYIKGATTGPYYILRVDNANHTVLDVQGNNITTDVSLLYFKNLMNTGETATLRYSSGSGMVTQLSSDIKFKKDVKEWRIDALGILSKFEPKQFIWKNDEKNKIRTGWIAQEAKDFIPDMFPYIEKEERYSLSEFEILPYFHKAIIQLKEENEKLKKEIEEIKSKLT